MFFWFKKTWNKKANTDYVRLFLQLTMFAFSYHWLSFAFSYHWLCSPFSTNDYVRLFLPLTKSQWLKRAEVTLPQHSRLHNHSWRNNSKLMCSNFSILNPPPLGTSHIFGHLFWDFRILGKNILSVGTFSTEKMVFFQKLLHWWSSIQKKKKNICLLGGIETSNNFFFLKPSLKVFFKK